MKNFKFYLGLLTAVLLFFGSCSDDDEGGTANLITPPTAEDFADLQTTALEGRTQTFTLIIDDTGALGFTSEKGVEVSLNTNCLQLDGMPVTGEIEVEFVEIFDRANMLVSNVVTMGKHTDGSLEMLVSGGAFYMNITKDGVSVDNNSCSYTMQIPADLTGGIDNDMSLWYGVEDENGNIVWEDADNAQGQGGGIEMGDDTYWVWASQFGWTNVDRFWNDPNPKTTIYADVPEGYNATNAAVFLSYDGEDNGLARLDTYDTETGLFSEHYGLIPIGLECHVIFVSEHNGQWVYAIKPYTVTENGTVTITAGDLATTSEAGLTALINALP